MSVERIDHPEFFGADDPRNMKDVDITSLVAAGVISYDQYVILDSSVRKAA